MGLAERAQALAEFHTMVRRDEIPKREDEMQKRASSDNLQDGPSGKDKAANPHKFRTADLLPPVIWDDR
jgi:hypothetical protein